MSCCSSEVDFGDNKQHNVAELEFYSLLFELTHPAGIALTSDLSANNYNGCLSECFKRAVRIICLKHNRKNSYRQPLQNSYQT